MSFSLVLTGTTGKLGGATLDALLAYNLISPDSLVLSTSSDPENPRWNDLKSQGVKVRPANFNNQASLEAAFSGCDRVFIVSSTVISLDYHDCRDGGREKHHIAAIEAARKAGVKHIYYTSLGFAKPSKAGVMRAHLVTEKYLQEQVKDVGWTVFREGLYNESWPLYLGHWNLGKDDRTVVRIAGDGEINWTSIPDLGLASALIMADDPAKWNHKVVTLSALESHTMKDVARMVSKASGRDIKIELVSRAEHERYYTKERGMDAGQVEWWSTTYDALPDGECKKDNTTLTELLKSKGRQPKPMEQTVNEMMRG